MRYVHRIGNTFFTVALAAFCAAPAFADQQGNPGVGKGETSQQKSQQGLGIGGDAGSSNVILGGPEIIIGRIDQVQGDEYSVQGEGGQSIKLRATKDTNKICAKGDGAKMSTGQTNLKEQHEIPISPATEEQMKSHDASRSQQQMQALNDPNQQQAEHQMPAPSTDPSKLKDVVGSTDQSANKDIARGSGFVVGGPGGCEFKAGDQVRIEASDMGTITTIKSLSQEDRSGSAVVGRSQEHQ